MGFNKIDDISKSWFKTNNGWDIIKIWSL